METLNNKTLSFSAKILTRAILAFATVLSMTACGNGGGGGGTTLPYLNPSGLGTLGAVTLNNCPTCLSTITSPRAIDMFSAKNGNGQASFNNVQVIVNNATFVPGVSSSYNLYSGPVAVQGYFVASTTLIDPVANSCVIPPGTYVMQTSSVGQMLMGTMQIPELVSSTGNIRMRLVDGILYKDAATQTTRLFGSVYITSVNGVMCSNSFSDTFN